MLALKPSCEHCNRALPPNSTEAMICSFECTFCRDCVDNVLENVCPNCGGGFVPRPIRPSQNLKGDFYLGRWPASETVDHKPLDPEAHRAFAAAIKGIPPEDR